MKKNEVYTELSIQIGVLEAKVDKILQLLLGQQNYIINSDFVDVGEGFDIEKFEQTLSTSYLYQTTGIVDDETFTTEFK